MKVTVIGAGGVGLGTAALISRNTHDVCLWAPSRRGVERLLDGAPIVCSGALEGEFPVVATLDIVGAIKDAEVVIIAVPGSSHRPIFDLLAPHVCSGQLVAISSHVSLSALYLARLLTVRNCMCPISAWASTATTGQRIGSGMVHVTSVRKEIVATAMGSLSDVETVRVLRTIFGDVFTPAPDLLAVTLANVSPEVHLAVAICNLTRIEYGENWGVYYGISSAVGNLIEDLDRERLRLASWFGFLVPTVREHLHRSFGLPLQAVAEMAAEQNMRRKGLPLGPATLEHRYVTEDIPFGIVPIVKFGKLAGVEMPLHNAGLELISSLYGRQFSDENDLLKHLDIEGCGAEGLRALSRGAYKEELWSGSESAKPGRGAEAK